jgi:hypothetical protein
MAGSKSIRANKARSVSFSPVLSGDERTLLVNLEARAKLSRKAPADGRKGMAWYNGLSTAELCFWHAVASSAVPADAWTAYKRGFQLDLLDSIAGTKSGLPEFQVLEDGHCIATLFDPDAAQQFATGMRANPENTGHEYVVREVRP